jgi:acetyl esterase/lipase
VFVCFVLLPGALARAEEPSFVDTVPSPSVMHDDFQLADGAAWDGRGRLFVPDVKGKRLLVFNLAKPEEAPKVRLEGLAISGCCYQLGQIYISDNGNSRIAVLGNSGPPKTIAQLDPKNRPNDLVVDALGNVYVTITREGVVREISAADYADEKKEAGQGRVVVKNLVTPNGIALAPDGSTLYVSSAKEGTISKITIDAQADTWTASLFAQLDETENGYRGDGMCVDRAGNIYCTGAETTSVFSPKGKRIDQIKTPERPINVVIGGTGGRSLFLSTFGGLYKQSVKQYGVAPNPPMGNQRQNDKIPSTEIPDNIQADLNLVYHNIQGRKLLADVFQPGTKPISPRPMLLVVHGGGWLKGDKTKFRALAIRLVKKGYVAAAVEYRLGYEAKFPAAIQDCNAATAFFRKNAAQFGIDPNRIGAVGGSAGGHLVGLMASGSGEIKLRHTENAEVASLLQAAVVMAGPLQTATGSVAERSKDRETNSNALHWIGKTIGEAPELYSLADAYEKMDQSMPPTLFISGSLDTPERNELSRQRMTELGIPTKLIVHENAKHGHWNRADWIDQVAADIDAFMKKHL